MVIIGTSTTGLPKHQSRRGIARMDYYPDELLHLKIDTSHKGRTEQYHIVFEVADFNDLLGWLQDKIREVQKNDVVHSKLHHAPWDDPSCWGCRFEKTKATVQLGDIA